VTDAVLAHGLGGSSDLPVPYAFSVIGAAWALTFTFALVAFAWRRPRFDPLKPAHPLPAAMTTLVDSQLTRGIAAAAALAFAVWVVLAGLCGPQTQTNALLGAFYVLLWVGLVAISLLFGPVWRVISPVRTVYLLLKRITPERLAQPRLSYPESWGYRPAALGLFAFVWMELASPNPAALLWVKTWLLSYAVVLLGGAWLCGQRWFARVDPFGVYSIAVSRLSPFRRDPETGRIAIGNPFDHLLSLPIRPGVVAVLAVLLGSTAFDSFSASVTWRNFADRLAKAVHVVPVTVSLFALRTIGLLVFVLVVATTFSLAARAAASRVTGPAGALADPHRGGLRLRPLPVLSRGARPAGRVRPRRSVRAGLESARAWALTRRLCAVPAPHGAGRDQGVMRGHRAHRRGDRGP
jgi:hypothetical protein